MMRCRICKGHRFPVEGKIVRARYGDIEFEDWPVCRACWLRVNMTGGETVEWAGQTYRLEPYPDTPSGPGDPRGP